ncbi:MAG: antitoxin family protein [Syntrophobacteraceae bacterium]|nr:antitoxin family protein [Syntrophobacteraceae bacterium]
MAAQLIEAVYEHGSFRPVEPVNIDLAEGQRVRLAVEHDAPDAILSLATRVYKGLNPEQIDSIEQHSHRRESFSGARSSA